MHVMFRNRPVAFSAAVAALILVAIPAPASAMPADPAPCPKEAETIAQSALAGYQASCNLSGVTVKLSNGEYAVVPPKNTGSTAQYSTPAGVYEPDVSIFYGSDGLVSIESGAVTLGEATRLRRDSSRGITNRLAPAVSPNAAPNRCSSAASDDWDGTGRTWISSQFDWWYNSAGSENSAALGILKSATAVWANGTNSCGITGGSNASATFKGTASYPVAVNSNGTCPGASGHSTFGWGNISTSPLAVTCTYWNALLYLTEADIKVDTGTSFYVSTGTSCGSKYDYYYTVTHEVGHAFGLDHATSNYDQTMKPTQSYCFTAGRKLGAGDLTGIRGYYGH